MSEKTNIIVAEIVGQKCLHFTSTKLEGNDVWFPLSDHFSLIEQVAQIMKLNSVAEAIHAVVPSRKSEQSETFEVSYYPACDDELDLMHKCPKCKSQELTGMGTVVFDPELKNFRHDPDDCVENLECSSCGHELSHDDLEVFWGVV